MDSDIFGYLAYDYYLRIDDSDRTMIIESFEMTEDTENGDTLLIKGHSLESLLDRRIVWEQTILTGSLQNGIKKILNDSIINPSNTSRKINNFIFSDSTDTRITDLTIDAQYIGDNVYEVVQKLCEDNKIGFKVILDDQNQFIFSLYVGTNRSYEQSSRPTIVFSPEFDNLANSNYLESSENYKNVALVGGEGEGSEQKFASVGDAIGIQRREIYVKSDISSQVDEETTMSDAEYMLQLATKGRDTLTEYTLEVAFDGELYPDTQYIFGVDYFIGDVVELLNKYGISGQVQVTEVIISEDENGYSVCPTFTKLEEE